MPNHQAVTTRQSFVRQHAYALLGIGALITWGLGAWGCLQFWQQAGQRHTLLDALYAGLQLFAMEFGVSADAELPWALEAARWMAPALLSAAAIKTVLLLASDQIQSFKAQFYRDHVVVVGLGRKGRRLVQDLVAQGLAQSAGAVSQIVVIESNADNDEIANCRAEGIRVIVGRASDPMVLRSARVQVAHALVVLTGDDQLNLEVAVHAKALAEAERGGDKEQPLRCFVHLTDRHLHSLMRDQDTFVLATPAFEARTFNIESGAARVLLNEFAPDAQRPVKSDHPVRIVVLGFGHMGSSVVLQAIRVGHYRNEKNIRIDILDRAAGSHRDAFAFAYPEVAKVAGLHWHEVNADGLTTEQLTALCEPGPIAAVYLCLGDDLKGVSVARKMRRALPDPRTAIVVSMRGAASAAFVQAPGLKRENISLFDVLGRTCNAATILADDLDKMARTIHDDFVRESLDRGEQLGSKPSLQFWANLPNHYRDSNRHQADHMYVKLRAYGCEIVPMADPRPAVPMEGGTAQEQQELEILARMEHKRWWGDKLADGFRYGPERNDTAKTHDNMVEWEFLNEKNKNKDRDAVRNIPKILAQLGLKPVRK